jgi:NitT/TauT family transport system substrate-binding protein
MARLFRGSYRRPLTLILVFGLLLPLAACGDDGNDAASPAKKQELTKLTILLGGKTMSWSPMYVADAQGYFKDEGLDVEIIASPQGSQGALAAVIGGDAFMAFSGALSGLAPIKQGAPVKLATSIAVKFAPQLTATKKFMEENNLTPESSLSDKVKAMKGATLGVLTPGDSVDQYFHYLFAGNGMDASKDATIQALNTPANQLAALQRGKVDVIAATPPAGSQAVSGGFGVIFLEPAEVPALDDYPYSVGVINTKQITENPDLLVKFTTAIMRGIQELRDEPDTAKPVLRKEFPEFSDADFDSLFTYTISRLPTTPVVTDSAYGSLEDFSEVQGDPLGVSYDEAVEVKLPEQGVEVFDQKYKK